MFGRRAKTPEAPPAPAASPGGPGKGRPTPRRSEAEKARRARAKPPTDRREAYRRSRAQARAAREKRRQALLSGDTRYLPARDQGRVRGLVRDLVDSRRSVAEYFLVLALVVLVASLMPIVELRAAAFYLWTIMLVVIIVDSTVLGLRLRRTLAQRFPDENRRGAIAYGIMRSTQLRRLRLPPPRVKPGQPV